MIKQKQKILLIMLFMLGIGAANSWGQVLMDLKDVTEVVTNDADTHYFANGNFSWTAGLRGNSDANVVTVDGKKAIKLSRTTEQLFKIQFATGKIKAGDHLIVEVARTNSNENLGFFPVTQTMADNTPSYAIHGYSNAWLPKDDTSDATKTYTIDYIIRQADINSINATTENIVLTGFWYSNTAFHSFKIVRHSDEESLPEISVIAPTSNTLTLAPGQKYTFKAETSGGEVDPDVVWRTYSSATPSSQHTGTDPHYGSQWTYTAPTTPGTYYIGADAQQLCVDKNASGGKKYEGSMPQVITVNVVDHALPKIEVSDPSSKSIVLGKGKSYTFKAQVSEGLETERTVVWREYPTATPESAYNGGNYTRLSWASEFTYTAPTTAGTHYIGADGQHKRNGNYESSTPHVITVNVIDHTAPGITVTAPISNTLQLAPGQTYVFKAHASGGEVNPTVVWRKYDTATPAHTYNGTTLSYDDELVYTAQQLLAHTILEQTHSRCV